MMDVFFDCLNVNIPIEHKLKCKDTHAKQLIGDLRYDKQLIHVPSESLNSSPVFIVVARGLSGVSKCMGTGVQEETN